MASKIIAKLVPNYGLLHTIVDKNFAGRYTAHSFTNSRLILRATGLSSRLFSSDTVGAGEDGTLLYEQRINVRPYGKLYLESALFPVHLDPAGPGINVITMQVRNLDDRHRVPSASERTPGGGIDSFGLKVNSDNGLQTYIVNADNPLNVAQRAALGHSVLRLQVPHHYNVEVRTKRRHGVTIGDLDADNLRVTVEAGDVIAENIKCQILAVSSVDGHVRCHGTVLGNVDVLTSGAGSISAGRLQGGVIKLHCQAGGITVNDIYGETNHIFCDSGDVSVTNLNGNSRLHVNSGDLKISYLDGAATLSMDYGNADIQVSQMRGNAMILIGSGNLDLKLLSSVRARVTLQGKDIFLGDGIDGNRIGESDHNTVIFEGSISDCITKEDPLFVAMVPHGKINIGTSQWMSGLSLFQTTDNKIA